jgi:hypothetical protein
MRLTTKARSNTFAHAILGAQGAEKQVSASLVNCTAMASSSWPCAKLSHSCIDSAPLSIPVSELIASRGKLVCKRMSTSSRPRARPRRPTQGPYFGTNVATGEQCAMTRFIRPYLELQYTPSSPHIGRLSAGRERSLAIPPVWFCLPDRIYCLYHFPPVEQFSNVMSH